MQPKQSPRSRIHRPVGAQVVAALVLALAACGMRSALEQNSPGAHDTGGATGDGGSGGAMVYGSGGSGGSGGNVVYGSGGRPSTGGSKGTGGGTVTGNGGRPGTGGATILGSGGRPGAGGATTTLPGQGGSPMDARPSTGGTPVDARPSTGGAPGSGGRGGTGGNSTGPRDALATTDVLVPPPGTPVIDPGSGYTTIATGNVVMSGYVASATAGSGSFIGLTYTSTSFCASGTVAANATYSSWANAGFSVNQAQSGSSGSTNSLVITGSTMSVSYVNKAGSQLEFQLWDGSNYWCYRLPPSTTPNTTTVPLSSLNTRCWDGTGAAFTSGTPITSVQLLVPGSATTPTPFDFCFLGLTIQ